MFSLVNKKANANVSKMITDAIKSSEQKGSCSTCPHETSTSSESSGNHITCSLGNGTPNSCVVNTQPTTTSVSNCPDGTKYEIKVKNKPGPTGPTGPAGPAGLVSAKLSKFENYLYEVPNSDEVYTVGLQSQVNSVHSIMADPVNHYFVNYLNSSVVWLYTNSNGSTGPYRITLRNVPDTSSNDNVFTFYMPTTGNNLETNYADTFIINDISYNVYWEGGLLPDLTDNREPSVVKQECNILPHFGTNDYRISARVSYYNTAPEIVKYYVRVELNVLDVPVYSFTEDPPEVGVSARSWTQQRVIYFQPGYEYIFDFSDPSNLFDPTPLIGGSVTQINARKIETRIVVGTIADNISSTLNFTKYSVQKPGTTGAEVIVKIPRIYRGDAIMYFDKNRADMGYQLVGAGTITVTDTLSQTVSNGATEVEITSDLSGNFPIGSTIVIGAGLFTEERFVVLGYGSILLGQRNAVGEIIAATTKYNHYKNEPIVGEKPIESIINVTVEQDVFMVDICNNEIVPFYNQYLDLKANRAYMFLQEDPSNKDNTILFGTTPDVLTSTFKSYMKINGSPGSSGAYTLLTVPSNMNNIVYFSGQNPYYGYGPLELDISSTTVYTQKQFIVNVINRTGVSVNYSISGDFDLSLLGENTLLAGSLPTPPIVSRLYYYIDGSFTEQKKFIFNVEDSDLSLNLNVQNPIYITNSTSRVFNRESVTISINNNQEVTTQYTIIYTNILQTDFINNTISTGSIPPKTTIDLTFLPQLTIKAKGTITAQVERYNSSVQVYREYIDYLREIATKPLVEYSLLVENAPNKVFTINNVPQAPLTFSPNTIYYFNQFNGSNIDERVVFGEEYDNIIDLYTDTVTNAGIPGQLGAYTILDLSNGFTKTLKYYSNTTKNMGYDALQLFVNQNTANYGDTIVFTIVNNTGANKSYEITGVTAEDIDNASLTGTLIYGQSHTLSYRLLCADKTLSFNINGLSETITIGGLPVVKFAVRTDPVYGNPVFAIEENGIWYNQKPKTFEAGKAYVIDLSNSVTSTYNLTFGTTVGGTPIDDIYIVRKTNEIILDLVNYQGAANLVYFDENNIAASYIDPSTYTNIPSLSVKVAGTPNTVFEINQILQNPLLFNANAKYIFDQSDASNFGEQLVFGRTFDDTSNLYTNGSEIVSFGTPGTPGAYTKIELPSTFNGFLYYFSVNSKNMGYKELDVQVSDTSVNYGDIVTFTIMNNTGVNKSYNITGIISADINNVPLTGTLSYGQVHSITYNITTAGKIWNFAIDTINKTISVESLPSTKFAVQTNANGNPVFATFDETDALWYNQPNLSFSAPNIYQIDLSSSILGYNLSFGPDGQEIPTQYILDKRPEENIIILDLRFYTGTAVTYFDKTGTVANYVDPDTTYPSAETFMVEVSSNPNKVFDISGISQKQIVFVAGTQYIFDQSHSSNIGEQIVFGKTFDDQITRLNSQSGVTIVGVPGEPDAYTLLDLSAGFQGTLYYFSETSVNMGYQPIDLQVDNSQKSYGDNVSFTITNNTGNIQPYNIVISNPNDLVGFPLSSTLNYGEIHVITYTIIGTNKTFTFYTGGENNELSLQESVSIASLSNNIQFAVETNLYGDSVFSTFNTVENRWLQQPDLSFSAPNVYQLDLSSSVTNDFNLTFGSNGQSIPSQYIIDKRPEENSIILDLRAYVGDAITYFDASGNAANYVNPDIAYPSAEKLLVQTGGTPLVFDICGNLQKDIGFSANQMYLFDQSHPSNQNYPLVFGSTHDVFDSAFLKSSIKTVGVPGYSGSYTLLDLSAGFQGPIYYFSTTSVNMGFVPLQSKVEDGVTTTKQYGDQVSFVVLNNTGTDVSYNISGVYSYDISDVSLTGSLGYGQEHTLTYTITGVGKTMVFSVGNTNIVTNSVIISDISATTFAIQPNKYGTPVYSIYDISDNVYYKQPSIKFGTTPKDVHLFDLSNSIVAPYELTFGVQVDGISIDSNRILRKPLDNQIVLDLRGFVGEVMYYDTNIRDMGYVEPTTYTTAQTFQVTISGDPLVVTMDNIRQKEISFSANQQYVFDQSHPSNANYPLVFATNPDVSYAALLKSTTVTPVGELGKLGAYTLLDLSAGFQGPLFYFSDASINMGFVPLSCTIDNSSSVSKEYGDNITFTILNNTGQILPYDISGTDQKVYSYDINDAPLTGSVGYGQEHQLTYTITGAEKTLVFSIGNITNNVEILGLQTTLFGVQNNIYDQPVYATYSDTKNTWYNQPNLIFSPSIVYQIDLSYVDYNINDYHLTFGTSIDDINSVLESTKISRRPLESKIILDLRDVSENVLYFDASNVGMGYNDPSVYTNATQFAVTLSGDPIVFAIDNVLQKAIDF